MKLLVVGSGGREHALAWKLAQAPRVQLVYVAPGNGGTAQDERLANVDITDIHELADFAERFAKVELVRNRKQWICAVHNQSDWQHLSVVCGLFEQYTGRWYV